MGLSGKFTPEVLGMTASSGLLSLVLEVAVLKFGFYLLDSEEAAIWDLMAYSGYIFVSLVVNHLVGILLGKYLYFSVMLVNAFFMAMFMVRTLRLLVKPVRVRGAAVPANSRNYFLLGIAVLQFVFSYFLGAY